MTYENFKPAPLAQNESGDERGSLFIDLLKEGINRADDSTTWNPLLMPELKLFDSKEPQKETTMQPQIETSTQPQENKPTQPQIETSTQPQENKPTQPQIETSTQPQENKPTQPQVEISTQPQENKPTQPPVDTSTQPQETRPAQPPEGTPAQPPGGAPTQPTDVPPQCQTDAPRPQTPPQAPTFETWGRFGRQYELDTAGNAVYEVRKGDTYSAVARDVLEKRTGRKYDVRDLADRNEILKLSKELADYNGVKWGKNNFVLIRPGDKIRIPGIEKPAPVACVHIHNDSAKPQSANPVEPVAARPKQPQAMAGAFSIQPQGKLYNLMQPPGLEGQPGQSWTKDLKVPGKAYDIDRRLLQSSRDIPDVGKEYVYSGKVDSGLVSGTNFTAREIIDAQGRIIGREIQYAEPLDMKVNLESTQNRKLKVVAAGAYFDSKSGTYYTQCRTADGQVFQGRQSADGTVLWGMNSVRP